MLINPLLNTIYETRTSSINNMTVPVVNNETAPFSEILARSSAGGSQISSINNTGLNSGSVNLDAFFEEAGRLYDLNPNLLKAVAKVESNFKPDAVSPVGALGIMQIMPATAQYLGVSNPFDARQSIMGGAKYLREQLDRFDGNISLALAAYNAGWPAVVEHGGIPPFEETQNYVIKVLELLNGGDITAGMSNNAGSGNMMTGGSNADAINFNALLKQMLFMTMMNMQMGMGGGNRSSFF